MYSLQITVAEEHKGALLEAIKSLDFHVETLEIGQEIDRYIGEENSLHTSQLELSSSVPVESSDSEENATNPESIAQSVTQWLDRNGVARVEFAKYINRSKSHLTDMLKRPPTSLPKGIGKEAWITMGEFMKDKNARKTFLEKAKRKRSSAGPRSSTATATATKAPPSKKRKPSSTDTTATTATVTEASPSKKQKPAKFEKWQQAFLDGIFVQCDGRPEKEMIKLLCPTLKLEQRQVNFGFKNTHL